MADPKTDCEAVLKRLYLYLDGEIAGEECAHFERHLAECAPCLDHAGFERDLKEIVRRKCAGEGVPEGLTQRLRVRLDQMLGPEPG